MNAIETMQRYPSSVSIGLEFRRGGIEIKGYFIPVKASGGRPSQGIKDLKQENLKFPVLNKLMNFMTKDSEGSLLRIIAVAIDCVKPKRSRLKVYVRSPHTSFHSISHIMTMANTSCGLQIENALKEVQELWHLTLGLDEHFPSAQELPNKEHQTSGVYYYFDIKAGNTAADPKLYIPVRHYARNGLAIAQGLGTFLSRKG